MTSPLPSADPSTFGSMLRDVFEPLMPNHDPRPWRVAAAELAPEDRHAWAELSTRFEIAGLHAEAAERLALVEVRLAATKGTPVIQQNTHP